MSTPSREAISLFHSSAFKTVLLFLDGSSSRELLTINVTLSVVNVMRLLYPRDPVLNSICLISELTFSDLVVSVVLLLTVVGAGVWQAIKVMHKIIESCFMM